MHAPPCTFCRIAAGEAPAAIVFTDEDTIGFLDHRPLFPGHVLLIPKLHFETLDDVNASLLAPLMLNAQTLARAVVQAMGAEGSFLAINNRVSQSVPHLHIHIVPRRRKDGLKGFFWPRHPYQSEEHMREVQNAIQRALQAE